MDYALNNVQLMRLKEEEDKDVTGDVVNFIEKQDFFLNLLWEHLKFHYLQLLLQF